MYASQAFAIYMFSIIDWLCNRMYMFYCRILYKKYSFPIQTMNLKRKILPTTKKEQENPSHIMLYLTVTCEHRTDICILDH